MRTLRICMMTLVVVAFAGASTPLFAAACPGSQPLANLGGSHFFNCPDTNPLNGFAYVISDPTVNNAGFELTCREVSTTNGQGNSCSLQPVGTAGDGDVTVLWNWANFNSNSCPNPSNTAGVGRQVVQIVANNGSSVNVCIGFDDGVQTYTLEYAMPDDGQFGALPVPCNFDSAPELISVTPLNATQDTVCVKLRPPKVYSDCDPTSNNKISNAGFIDTCEPGAAAKCAGTPGRLYVRTAPCGTSPDPRISTGWSLQTTVPGPSGSVCFLATRPAAGCGFVGATAFFGSPSSTESLAMVGSWQLAQAAASSPKATIDRAALGKGIVSVNFHTTTEVGAIGFNVLANGAVLNGSLIAAGTDGGGHKYNFTVKEDVLRRTVGKIKSKGGALAIVVQTMTQSGPVNSDAVKLQVSK